MAEADRDNFPSASTSHSNSHSHHERSGGTSKKHRNGNVYRNSNRVNYNGKNGRNVRYDNVDKPRNHRFDNRYNESHDLPRSNFESIVNNVKAMNLNPAATEFVPRNQSTGSFQNYNENILNTQPGTSKSNRRQSQTKDFDSSRNDAFYRNQKTRSDRFYSNNGRGSNRDDHERDRNDNEYRGGRFGQSSGSSNNYNEKRAYTSKYERGRSYNTDSYNTGYESKKSSARVDFEKDRRKTFQRDEDALNNDYLPEKGDNTITQRGRLIEQLQKGRLECLICCDRVTHVQPIWSCFNCYHILHLACVIQWAEKSTDDSWRCPACQYINVGQPDKYRCFCGKVPDPDSKLAEYPHSCGDVCGRVSKRTDCPHTCTIACHPGPCPPCEIFVKRKCGCGATESSVACNNDVPLVCNNTCKRLLNCQQHQCEKLCHQGDCAQCDKIFQIECHCSKETKTITCAETRDKYPTKSFSCQKPCEKKLNCNNHTCSKTCHDGPCDECPLTIDRVKTCPCGKMDLKLLAKSGKIAERVSCLDPIPCCLNICNKPLKCGQPYDPHTCQQPCHMGECPVCPDTTMVRCRCGHMDRELLCKQLTGRADDARCEKKCTKKRTCARHKCNNMCCIDIDHECMMVCNRPLTCGQHRCELRCHKGRCPPCYQSSFSELYCECGVEVIMPPVACGTRPPSCRQPCSRQHPCDHEVIHQCHSQPQCPPCTILTAKWCHGNHEQRKTIPCHIGEFSCGRPCGQMLPCGRHRCQTLCHTGPCLAAENICKQPCQTPRASCEHPCAAQCHDGACPNTLCKVHVTVTCQCGNLEAKRVCHENYREFQRLTMARLVSKTMDSCGSAVTIDVTAAMNDGDKLKNMLKTLECIEECRVIERNRKLAESLQIRNPDLSTKIIPRYSDYMKSKAKIDPKFAKMVHDKLTELVQSAKASVQKSRSYSFEVMNYDKRQFVHEYCEHFACESQAYDKEPHRNVVATAHRDRCQIPSYSLLQVVEREMGALGGPRRVPGPILHSSDLTTVRGRGASTLLSSARPATNWRGGPSGAHKNELIDYFDDPLD